MKVYTDAVENGCVEALLLIEPKEAALWQDTETAVNAAITQYAREKELGLLLFPRVLELDEQEDGAILLHFEAAQKPEVLLGQYRGLHTGVPKTESERFAEAALNAAAENASMTIPALLVDRRLELMALQRRKDVLESVSYNTLADVCAILNSVNEEGDIPQSPEVIWAKAVNVTAQLNREGERRSVDGLLSLLAESLYGENYDEQALRGIGNAVEKRVRQKQEMDVETAADELFALYLRMRGESLEQWREKNRNTAAELVRTELMLDAVVEREGLALGQEELERELERLGALYGISQDEVRELAGEENLRFQLLRAKARALIIDSTEA